MSDVLDTQSRLYKVTLSMLGYRSTVDRDRVWTVNGTGVGAFSNRLEYVEHSVEMEKKAREG